jgi:hypothetical protein
MPSHIPHLVEHLAVHCFKSHMWSKVRTTVLHIAIVVKGSTPSALCVHSLKHSCGDTCHGACANHVHLMSSPSQHKHIGTSHSTFACNVHLCATFPDTDGEAQCVNGGMVCLTLGLSGGGENSQLDQDYQPRQRYASAYWRTPTRNPLHILSLCLWRCKKYRKNRPQEFPTKRIPCKNQ